MRVMRHALPGLVAITHGQGPAQQRLDLMLRAIQARHSCRVEHVRTDRAPGQFLPDPNQAFEFSGYQEGLLRLLNDAAWLAASPTADAFRVVIFINDTIVNGHSRRLVQRLLLSLLQLQSKPWQRPALVGLATLPFAAVKSVAGVSGYVPTYAFGLCGRVEDLRRVSFFGTPDLAPEFLRHTWPALPAAYVQHVQGWLEPSHLLKGWYKAVPGRPLDAATRQRKQQTIYLEHSLPARLARLGFELVDLVSLAAWPGRLQFEALKLLDRAHVNRLKLRKRLPLLWQRAGH
jgi:hypothetical protein